MRVGFVSSGFNSHPTALLTVELIERLRGEELTTVGFATTPDDGTPLRARIARAFGRFVDVAGLDAPAIATRIRDANVDVLFDLRGYGGGSVSEVFALRPAPVQVNWLAYPGTSGAPFIDYLVADRVVVPDEQRAHYSEAIAYLPHCFQPSDTTRVVAPPPSRAACGLPDAPEKTGPVLASFNNAYKIAPDTFACWMRILGAVPDACLWLLGDAQGPMAANLRDAARRARIDTERLHFMAKRPHAEYLARYGLVDLFLDTWPYNAHTTASDALWAGCPVLTLPGSTFASRVAASLLHTLGLDELVARDADDYVARATRLAGDAPARNALRARVAAARAASPLFDMGRYAADFARLVRALAARSARGLAPADL
ncbi:MAG TPA: hypothetical protein VFO79_14195 [Xanthomonadales bacterium]|nr:hypothetical protein [Xanthomonadales bacterium]